MDALANSNLGFGQHPTFRSSAGVHCNIRFRTEARVDEAESIERLRIVNLIKEDPDTIVDAAIYPSQFETAWFRSAKGPFCRTPIIDRDRRFPR